MQTKITRSYFSIFQIDNHHLRGNLKDYHVRLLLVLLLLPKNGIENETMTGTGTGTGTRSDFVRFALCKHTHGINRFPLSFCTSRVLYIASLVARISQLGFARAAYYPATVNVVSRKNAVSWHQRRRGKHFLSLWPSTKLELVKRHTFLCTSACLLFSSPRLCCCCCCSNPLSVGPLRSLDSSLRPSHVSTDSTALLPGSVWVY